MSRLCRANSGLQAFRWGAVAAFLAVFGLVAGPARAQVRISEVLANPVGTDDTNQKIELTNFGNAVEVIGGLRICNQFRYATIPSGVTLDPGETYVIHHRRSGTNDDNNWYVIGTLLALVLADDSYALYKAAGAFTDPAAILDYVQWGAGAQPRENVAAGAGIWSAGDFTAVPAEGQSLQLCDPQSHGSAGWAIAPPTIGAANACATPTPKVVLNEVLVHPVGYDSTDQLVEIANRDAAPVDLADWQICFQFVYWGLPSVLLNPGGKVIVHLNVAGIDSGTDLYTGPLGVMGSADAMALYLPIGSMADFDDPAFIVDFVQWGGGGMPRENVAVAAGIWVADDALASPGLGHSLERCADAPGLGSWGETPDLTFGADNSCSATGIPVGTPRVTFVGAPTPNPMWDCAIVDFELTSPARVLARIRDVRGRVVEVLADQTFTAGRQSVVWEGSDSRRTVQRPGVYFLEIWSPTAMGPNGTPLHSVQRVVRRRR